ncbi:hypothetical protein SRHO_G00043060 [Serrasalmus rhombeus]
MRLNTLGARSSVAPARTHARTLGERERERGRVSRPQPSSADASKQKKPRGRLLCKDCKITAGRLRFEARSEDVQVGKIGRILPGSG